MCDLKLYCRCEINRNGLVFKGFFFFFEFGNGKMQRFFLEMEMVFFFFIWKWYMQRSNIKCNGHKTRYTESVFDPELHAAGMIPIECLCDAEHHRTMPSENSIRCHHPYNQLKHKPD